MASNARQLGKLWGRGPRRKARQGIMGKRKLQVITNSEHETWRTCQRRHGFAYFELLRPKVDSLPKRAGNVLHDGLSAGWRAAWELADCSLDSRLDRAISGAVAGVGAATTVAVAELEEIGDTDPNARVDEAIEALLEASKANAWAVENYFRSIKPDLAYVPVVIEGEFAVRVPNAAGRASRILRRGKIDLTLWDPELNRLIVHDHKGTANAVTAMERKLPLDTQLTGYVVAIRRMVATGQLVTDDKLTTVAAQKVVQKNWEQIKHANTGAIAYNVIRRKRPEHPKINLLKKGQILTDNHRRLFEEQSEFGSGRGEVSVAECDTTAEEYRTALEEQVVDRELPITDKQRLVLERLERKGETFFAQLEYFRDDLEIEEWRRELFADARRIREVARDPSQRTRNPTACAMPWSPPCAYASLCLNPSDPVARAGYMVADRPHVELEGKKNGE